MSKLEIEDLAATLFRTGVGEYKISKFLTFAYKGMKLDDEQSAKEIVDAIAKNEDLEALELKGNTLGVEASKSIGKALERKTSIKRALWSDLFTGRLKSEIPSALKNLCSGMMIAGARLVELDLSDNAFGPNGMLGLTDFLKSESCYSLKELRLNNNGLGIQGGKMLAESLQACYESSVKAGQPLSLEIFVSGRGRLENEGATALAGAFKSMKSLVEVHMPQNGINHQGVTALAEAFSCNPDLKILNLSDNTFTERGSVSIAKALEKLKNLEEINFEDCLVRTEGVIAICNALKCSNDNLKVLILSGNELTMEGAEAVVEAIKKKKNLRELQLNCNQFGEKGIKVLKKCLKQCDKLSTLGSLSCDTELDSSNLNVKADDVEDDNQKKDQKDVKSDIESFLENPTASQLKSIHDNNRHSITNYLEDLIDNIDDASIAIMKMAQVCVSDSSSSINSIVYGYADAFYKKAFDEVSFAWVANSILLSLGLIKGERKNITLVKDIKGPCILLAHIIVQKYFPPDAKNVLSFFFERNTNLDDFAYLKEVITQGSVAPK
ncbi:hypothetical protein HELRODRAFT_189800 [Helobdella robusta]|uniref:Ran-GTPase activating protein 1 C-terminal domain-containing protein n=1 Tax=Helobdella robusta TaxID=6412 RepID=T1FRD5_HELRO|nr:hypothetical protein HELRODRAFT_189800 [Helobdella robusta]ESN91763.1 hypothetical protein HELRODRAFT_189800 [Helobdella robusta]